MNKEKQIYEMAKEIMKPQDCKGYEDNRGCYFSNGKGCDKCKIERHENAQIMADHLYNLGYRKITENEVVLTLEEVFEFREDQAKVKFLKNQLQEEARKETAEKIYTFVNSFGTHNWERFKEFIKQFGVDLGE